MFVPTEPIAEFIAHFIGYFEIRYEEGRIRLDYDAFQHQGRAPVLPENPAAVHTGLAPVLTFFGSAAPILYSPPAWSVVEAQGASPEPGKPAAMAIHVPPMIVAGPHAPFGMTSAGEAVQPLEVGPGSVVLATSQIAMLSDDDVVVLGADGGIAVPWNPLPGLDALAGAAFAIEAPLTALGAMVAPDEIPRFLTDVGRAFEAMASAAPGEGETVHALSGPADDGSFDGIYVDGRPVDVGPELDAALPPPVQALLVDPSESGEDAGSVALAIATDGPAAISVQSGANYLANGVTLVSAGVTTSVLAVNGDFHQVNAVLQTNAYSDADSIGPGIPGLATVAADASTALNIASFAHQELDTGPVNVAADVLPQGWSVSVVEGDLSFVNWVTQYSFASDADLHVLSATGYTTTIGTGENVGLNDVTIADLGQTYDLVIVGGSFYDGNIITQTNVLDDDDWVGTIAGPAVGVPVADEVPAIEGVAGPAPAAASIATGANLMWNSASIVNIGPGNIQAGMPDGLRQAADSITGGDHTMPAALASNPAFAGVSHLSALYVTGDLYNLNYVQQTNVLGDADFVGLYEQHLDAASPDTDWTISTGSNALVNSATILDYDALGGSAHVGGQIYSDAVLIQAELVGHQPADQAPAGAGPPPESIANEAIAFLGDDEAGPSQNHDHTDLLHGHVDAPPVDILQSVLA